MVFYNDDGFGGGYGVTIIGARGFDDDDDDDTGRKNKKSNATMQRQIHAKGLVDAFLKECLEQTTTSFPITKEVVPPQVHLTDASWKSLRQYVLKLGCTTKRREATRQERIDSKDNRRGKLYVISITVPSKAIQAIKEKQEKEDQAWSEKLEKAAQLRKERAIKQQEEKGRTEEEYKAIVAAVTNSLEQKKEGRPAKKAKLAPPTVPRHIMLVYAMNLRSKQSREQEEQLDQEKSTEREIILKKKMSEKEREKRLSQLESNYTDKRKAMKETQREIYQHTLRYIQENCLSGFQLSQKQKNGN